MPTKNVVKEYGEDCVYHVYNRGVDKMTIFREDNDYVYFLHLLKRYLSNEVVCDKKGRTLPNYSDAVDLIAYCLMPNHFHLMFYLKEKPGIEHLMRSVMTSYSKYFNRKYKRLGPLFQNRFLASRVADEAYFWHISRYIHLNPLDIKKSWESYPYSSIGFFTGMKKADWVHPQYIVGQGGISDYLAFLADYEDAHAVLGIIKHELANKIKLQQ